jgi:hypothetical protein
MPRLFLIACLVLAACGADGEPEPPEPRAQSDVTITGDARVGVVLN